MKKARTILTLLTLMWAGAAMAQVSIEAAAPKSDQIKFVDKIKQNEVKVEFSNEAQERAARAAIRRERNTLEINASLNGSLSNFNSKWQSVNGNTNSITAISGFLLTHTFSKGRFTIDNKVSAKLGATNKESEWTKNQDEWFVSTAPASKISNTWNFGGLISLRSQFANGIDDASCRTSRFFSPAYLNISLGFTYVCPKQKFPIKIYLSPITMNSTYVSSWTVRDVFFNKKGFTTVDGASLTYDQFLANPDQLSAANRNTSYCYGLTLDDGTSRYEGGSSVQIDFDRTFGKKGIFRYRTTIYSFYGWINELAQQSGTNKALFESIVPTLRWEHTVDIKATKFFSTQFYFQMYYNKAQIKSLQTQIVLGVGLSYTFKNK